jgi:hypothetical protein
MGKYTEESILAIADYISTSDENAKSVGKISCGIRTVETKLENLRRFFTPSQINSIISNQCDIRDVLRNAGILKC